MLLFIIEKNQDHIKFILLICINFNFIDFINFDGVIKCYFIISIKESHFKALIPRFQFEQHQFQNSI